MIVSTETGSPFLWDTTPRTCCVMTRLLAPSTLVRRRAFHDWAAGGGSGAVGPVGSGGDRARGRRRGRGAAALARAGERHGPGAVRGDRRRVRRGGRRRRHRRGTHRGGAVVLGGGRPAPAARRRRGVR